MTLTNTSFKLTDKEFYTIISKTLNDSTKASDYTADCFVTSEVAHNEVISKIFYTPKNSQYVYLGIGPCQNFTYLGVSNPALALITDARLDNHLEHLIFKLIFEKAKDPLEYLTLLFSRINDKASSFDSEENLIEHFEKLPISSEYFNFNLNWILDEMRKRWNINSHHEQRIERIYNEFFRRQLSITSVSENALKNLDKIPNLKEVILAKSSQGFNFHFLTDKNRFNTVKKMHHENRIVPIHGNFTSEESLNYINGITNDFGIKVGVVYISNMEEFLLKRYIISNDKITSRPNPEGLLTDKYKGDYEYLVNFLSNLNFEENCMLIRFYFPGTYNDYRFGVHPWLEGHTTKLSKFLEEYKLGFNSIFESYL